MDELMDWHINLAEDTVGGVTGTATIKPNRNRSRQESVEGKMRPGRPGDRKKPATSQKAPARGRYIDEYARPAI
jgi:hypothetical protein